MDFNKPNTYQTEIKKMIENVITKMYKIESTLNEEVEYRKNHIESQNRLKTLLDYGLKGFQEKAIETYKETGKPLTAQDKLLKRIKNDDSLTCPQKKILNYMSQMYDFRINEFKEVYQSQIIKACKLGKNMAKRYFFQLIDKGYIKRRDDGYRIWYKIK